MDNFKATYGLDVGSVKTFVVNVGFAVMVSLSVGFVVKSLFIVVDSSTDFVDKGIRDDNISSSLVVVDINGSGFVVNSQTDVAPTVDLFFSAFFEVVVVVSRFSPFVCVISVVVSMSVVKSNKWLSDGDVTALVNDDVLSGILSVVVYDSVNNGTVETISSDVVTLSVVAFCRTFSSFVVATDVAVK